MPQGHFPFQIITECGAELLRTNYLVRVMLKKDSHAETKYILEDLHLIIMLNASIYS